MARSSPSSQYRTSSTTQSSYKLPDDDSTSATNSQQSSPPLPALTRRLLRKLDLHILPPLFILFAVAFLDRSNLGNARIEGLEASLHMDPRGHDYNNAVWIFVVPYVLFEVPSNLVLRRYRRPGWWLAGLMFAWAICTIGQGLVNGYKGLLVCRFLMGVFEAGFIAGCAILIASYYKRHEFLLRYSIFFSASIIATGFSAFLAYLLAKMNGIGGYQGWRWIFIIEGLGTVVISVFAFFTIVPWPESAAFLTPEEKALMLVRLQEDESVATPANMNWQMVKEIAVDWKLWLATLAYFAADFAASSNTYFQPTILSQLGYTDSQAQVHAIPIYMTAFVISILSAYASDHLRNRSAFALAGAALCATGWAIELAQAGPPGARYAALFLIVTGAFVQMPNLVVWMANNTRGSAMKRAVSTAVLIGGGNCAAFVSSNVFLGDQAPGYPAGYGTGLGMTVMGACCVVVLVVGIRRANRRLEREEGGRRERRKEGEVEERWTFRYTL